jgi:phosphate/sulfate permease
MEIFALLVAFPLTAILLALLGFWYVQRRADERAELAEKAFLAHIREQKRKIRVKRLQDMQANHDPFHEPPLDAA